jgi:hypothetical protein
VHSLRRPPIVACTEVAAPPEAVFAFLNRLENHAGLAPSPVQVLYLHTCPDGGAHALVRLTGPLGVRRSARTDLLRTPLDSTYVAGRATIGDHTEASVTWTIEPTRQGSLVTLFVSLVSTGFLDWLLLSLGARRWLASQFRAAVGRLSMQLCRPTVYTADEPLPLALMNRAA